MISIFLNENIEKLAGHTVCLNFAEVEQLSIVDLYHIKQQSAALRGGTTIQVAACIRIPPDANESLTVVDHIRHGNC